MRKGTFWKELMPIILIYINFHYLLCWLYKKFYLHMRTRSHLAISTMTKKMQAQSDL